MLRALFLSCRVIEKRFQLRHNKSAADETESASDASYI